ncbi:outer membrane beta-barrel protein [Arenibaculum pallidiluteum]|uniref:outer membrane beta-barrel protein n=1 Tax=Arenibaculum pallidiluteum TaxID=2812559 RepID=UPI001A96B849|nr:outer membrane beta-barrel protein [Arenibaculum pallidiluteum]
MTKILSSLPTAVSAIAILIGTATVAQAQQQPNQVPPDAARPSGALERGASVVDRQRPEFDPLGIRAGSFLIFPQVEAGVTWDSNVFASEDNSESDFLLELSPSVTARNESGVHFLQLRAGADIGRYVDQSSEKYIDFLANAAGRYDIARETRLSGELGVRGDHEAGGDPDSPTDRAEPVDYRVGLAQIGLRQGFNRFAVSAGGSVEYRDYDDVRRRDGLDADQDFRDRTIYATTLRGSYELQPGIETFVRGTYDWTRYRLEERAQRDSTGWEIAVGSDFDLTGLLTGSAYVGYEQRDYDNDLLEDPSGISAGVRLDWAVTQLTSVTGEVTRKLEETTSLTVSARERTLLRLGVDHELLRNLILNGTAGVRRDDFQGSTREDDYLLVGAGATYLMNRNVYVRGGWDFITRDSNTAGNDYDRHLVTLRLGTRL